MKQSHNWKWLPAISAKEFTEHIEEESFPVQYGNPVRIYTDDVHEYICLTIELYERMFGEVSLPDGVKTGNGDETE